MNNQLFLTQEGHDKLTNELKELKEVKRRDAVSRLERARQMGDLSENSEYTAAIEHLSFVDGRINELEQMLSHARIVSNHTKSDTVKIGSQVTVEYQEGNETFMIVGETETNIEEKKIAYTSPVGRALMGKKVGMTVEVVTPSGMVNYKIRAVA